MLKRNEKEVRNILVKTPPPFPLKAAPYDTVELDLIPQPPPVETQSVEVMTDPVISSADELDEAREQPSKVCRVAWSLVLSPTPSTMSISPVNRCSLNIIFVYRRSDLPPSGQFGPFVQNALESSINNK